VRIESGEAIRDYLEDHYGFRECILQDVAWRRFGTVLDLVFDFIWASDGVVRQDLDKPQLVRIRLHVVQELHVVNALNDAQVLRPEDLTWGLSEVARVDLIDDPAVLARYQALPLAWHHIRCSWEGSRQLDIVFSYMEVDPADFD
jgi:hypothetical protein